MKPLIPKSNFEVNSNSDTIVNNFIGGLAIVAIVQNQARYIEDWIKFHFIAGVTEFIIYDDCSSDNTVEVLHILNSANQISIKVIPWSVDCMYNLRYNNNIISFDNQSLSYVHAIKNYGKYYDKMAFIDTDEYLVPVEVKTINEAIMDVSQYSNIKIPYTMYANTKYTTKPDETDVFAYTERGNRKNKEIRKFNCFKCIVDPKKATLISVHQFRTTDLKKKCVSESGLLLEFVEAIHTFMELEPINLQLNHYYIRSDEEFDEKCSFFRSDTQHFRDKKNRLINERNILSKDLVEDRTAINFLKRHGINNNKEFKEYQIP